MQAQKHIYPYLILLLLLIGCTPKNVSLSVIPQPQSVEWGKGVIKLPKQTAFFTNLKGDENTLLCGYLKASPLSLQETADSTKEAIINFIIKNDSITFDTDEAYQLSVTDKCVKITARGGAGLFYGFQTLLQLVKQEKDTFALPCLSITDSPRFVYRGLHLDVSRHFKSKEFVKKQLDAMARYKLNRFHWHLTDGAGWRIEIKKYPELTEQTAYRAFPDWKAWWKGGGKYCAKEDSAAQGGYYTQEDIREVVAYARERFITVIPEIEMPGHSEEVLAVYPQLACSGKPYVNSELCVGKEETFSFLQNVLDEVMTLFPSEYIHIGGDEAEKSAWKACSLCQQRIKKEGLKDEEELQSYLIKRIEKYLVAHHRKLLGWDEILQGGLPPEATVMSWRGEEGGITAAKSGHQVIMTPGEYCYLDGCQDAPLTQPDAIGGYLPLQKVYSYNPVPKTLTPSEAQYIMGVQANVWAEYMSTPEHTEYMIYPRLLALAEVAWTQPEKKDWADFHLRALNEVCWLQKNGYHPFDLSKEVGERKEAASPISHLALNKSVKYAIPYATKYAAGGDSALVDGKRGGWTYGDKRWQGFLNTNIDVTVDLGKETKIHSIAAEFMQLSGPYVWLPREVIISTSLDGKTFIEQKRISTFLPTTYEKLAFRNYQWTGKVATQYVRYQALSNGIDGGWLFTDEIIIR
ncbi:MAG: family 20 glycosylhydrolase [Bacteroidaceae bacterium]